MSEENIQGVTIKGELDTIVLKELAFKDIIIADVPPLPEDNFEDPYKFVPPPVTQNISEQRSEANASAL